jgi:hypothetical protein
MNTGRCIFEGEFGEIHVSDLLTFLDMIKRTGALELERGSERKSVYWDRGEIVFATSSLPAEQLSEYLRVNGWVAPEALADARSRAPAEEEVIRHLIGDGSLEPAVLPRAVRNLVLDIVYTAFEWHEGHFRFVVTEAAHGEHVPLRTSTSNIIMEGTRRLDEWQRIRQSFPHDNVYPMPRDGTDVDVNLPPIEQEILGHVDGRRSVASIVQAVTHDQFTTLGALLTLLNAGAITVSDVPLDSETTADLEVVVLDDGLAEAEREAAGRVLEAFNAMFAAIHERIAAVKGDAGVGRFRQTLQKPSFQRNGVLTGVEFGDDGPVPTRPVLVNTGRVSGDQRLARLRGTLDRLLAQLVVQLDQSYDARQKRAVSDLIAAQKAGLDRD